MRVDLILFFVAAVVLFYYGIRSKKTAVDVQQGPQQTTATATATKKKISVGWIIVIVLVPLGVYLGYKWYNRPVSQMEAIAQIYPNYDFSEKDQLKVRLIPSGQRLSREVGGWIITPPGSEYRIDYNTPVIIEYVDGRKFIRQPNQPAHDGVRPTNGIFRLYGKEGESAEVFIKRNVY